MTVSPDTLPPASSFAFAGEGNTPGQDEMRSETGSMGPEQLPDAPDVTVLIPGYRYPIAWERVEEGAFKPTEWIQLTTRKSEFLSQLFELCPFLERTLHPLEVLGVLERRKQL